MVESALRSRRVASKELGHVIMCAYRTPRAGIFNGRVLRDIPSRGQCLTCCVPAGRWCCRARMEDRTPTPRHRGSWWPPVRCRRRSGHPHAPHDQSGLRACRAQPGALDGAQCVDQTDSSPARLPAGSTSRSMMRGCRGTREYATAPDSATMNVGRSSTAPPSGRARESNPGDVRSQRGSGFGHILSSRIDERVVSAIPY